MRLTLRTLLAYLDDTLEPTEIKQIGQKVAESDTAQELIARIKQITRRRRLTTPPLTGPGAANFDPNLVAEYLDNELNAEQIAEVEKLCLESDVHLAEISTCHQILTLVLGEPALVPPTARERMYGLVQGKESIPFRKAGPTHITSGAPAAANGSRDESDAALRMGLPAVRRTGWLRWALPAAGALLIASLALALWKAMPTPADRKLAQGNGPKDPPPEVVKDGGQKEPVKDKDGGKDAQPDKSTTPDKGATPEKTPDKTPDKEPMPKGPPDPTPAAAAIERPAQPAVERREAGSYFLAPRSAPSVLVSRQGEQPWRRLTPGSKVFTSEPLVSLPGSLSEVRFAGGVHAQLRGHVREYSLHPLMDFLLESAVTPHANKNFDLELTLERGRVYLSNHKDSGPATVRLRFQREIWDLTLQEPGAEVGIDLIKHYTPDVDWKQGEEPRAEVYLCVLKGKAALKVDQYLAFPILEAPPGPAFFLWNNKGPAPQSPIRLEQTPPIWEKTPPMTKEAAAMTAALEEMSKRLTDRKAVDVVLLENLQAPQAEQRLLSIYSLSAVDDVRKLLDVLADEDPNHGMERVAALYTLRRWLARGPEMGKQLYDAKERTGLLVENRKYLSGEAQTVLNLLYGFTDAEQRAPETYSVLADYLLSPKIAIRELSISHLYRMGAPVKYNPAWPEPERQKAAAEVKKMVEDKKLPPPAKAAPGAPR